MEILSLKYERYLMEMKAMGDMEKEKAYSFPRNRPK